MLDERIAELAGCVQFQDSPQESLPSREIQCRFPYLLVPLFREANAETPEVSTMEVGTARVRLFKVGALVCATHRRIWFRVASHWPGAAAAVRQHICEIHELWRGMNPFVRGEFRDLRDRTRIQFTPVLLK